MYVHIYSYIYVSFFFTHTCTYAQTSTESGYIWIGIAVQRSFLCGGSTGADTNPPFHAATSEGAGGFGSFCF